MITQKKSCFICDSRKLVRYLDLGKTALANSYVAKKDLSKKQLVFPLRVSYCQDCHLAQLTDVVSRDALFTKYDYFSSASPQLHDHFAQYAKEVFEQFPEQTKKLTLEIASNDGILLKPFKALGARVLGVDPAKNIAKLANQEGIETLPVFFNAASAKKILKKYGQAGIISANNVLAHTDNIHSIMEGVKTLLAPDGVFVFETQYLADLLAHNEFDNTYHEHTFYYSLAPLITLLAKYRLQVFDVKRVSTQGGSLRIYAGHAPLQFPINPSVESFLQQEKKQGLYKAATYKKFGSAPKKIKADLAALLKKLKKEGKQIVGYGAAAKTTTLLAYCGIGKNMIDYIVDDSPQKQGKYMPGNHIPIVSSQKLKEKTPDYVVLLAWNYADSIMAREKWLKEKGAKFIKIVPGVTIV